MGYISSPIRDFESCLRIEIGLDEDDIQLILNKYNEKFVTYALHPGNYTIKDLQEAVYTIDDHEETLKVEYDDISMKKNLVKYSLVYSYNSCKQMSIITNI